MKKLKDRLKELTCRKMPGTVTMEITEKATVGITEGWGYKDLARLTSSCDHRYYWVVTKTCVVRAIFKDVFAKMVL